jgi:hypothetical protein
MNYAASIQLTNDAAQNGQESYSYLLERESSLRDRLSPGRREAHLRTRQVMENIHARPASGPPGSETPKKKVRAACPKAAGSFVIR